MAREEFETSTSSLLDAGTTGDRRVKIADHSSLPWKVYDGPMTKDAVFRRGRTVLTDNGDASHAVAYCDYLYPKVAEANAAFIVRAVNAHEELVAALKYARECITYCRKAHKDAQSGEGFPVEMIIDAVLAKATRRENKQDGED